MFVENTVIAMVHMIYILLYVYTNPTGSVCAAGVQESSQFRGAN